MTVVRNENECLSSESTLVEKGERRMKVRTTTRSFQSITQQKQWLQKITCLQPETGNLTCKHCVRFKSKEYVSYFLYLSAFFYRFFLFFLCERRVLSDFSSKLNFPNSYYQSRINLSAKCFQKKTIAKSKSWAMYVTI